MEHKESFRGWIFIIALAIIAYFIIQILTSCSTTSNNPTSIIRTPQQSSVIDPIVSNTLIKLTWETPQHLERSDWSKSLLASINDNFTSLDKAKDIVRFCPTYQKLNKSLKMQAWAELFVSLANFESSFNFKASSVDVGDPKDKNSSSVGLFQVSQTDIANYKLPGLALTYESLLLPEPNIKLALALMAQQIDKHGLVVVDTRSQVYWITLYDGGWFNYNDKTDEIIAHVKGMSFCQ